MVKHVNSKQSIHIRQQIPKIDDIILDKLHRQAIQTYNPSNRIPDNPPHQHLRRGLTKFIECILNNEINNNKQTRTPIQKTHRPADFVFDISQLQRSYQCQI